MKSKVNALFFLFGLAAFTFVLWRFGVDHLIVDIREAGWSLLAVVIVWFFIYSLNAVAWRSLLGEELAGISAPRLFAIKVAGFTINTLTPFLAMGGEPYQVKVLGDLIGTQRALPAVIVYRMVHLIGHMTFLCCACIWAVLAVGLPDSLTVLMAVCGIASGTIVYLTVRGHQNGIFVLLQRWLLKYAWTRSLGLKMANASGGLQHLDELITHAYTKHRPFFVLAVVCEIGARLLMGAEIFVILRGVGVAISMPDAIFLYAFYSILVNLAFFIPLNLGIREGGLVLGVQSLSIAPLVGVYVAVVIRLREFVWIGVGLLFTLLGAGGQPARERTASAPENAES